MIACCHTGESSLIFHRHFFCNEEGIKFKIYTCMQIFVSDKSYVFIAAMKSVSEFTKDLNFFAKEVGVPEAIISDSHKCHKYKEVRQFCHKIVTTLRVLKGSTQRRNRAELYVSLFKEAVRKYMLQENPPLVFWD